MNMILLFKKAGRGPAVLLCVMLAACFPEKPQGIPPEQGVVAGENLSAGAGEAGASTAAPGEAEPHRAVPGEAGSYAAALEKAGTYISALEELAETERSGGFTPGMGLSESMIREWSGDYGGAVIAAYKELSWAYGYGAGVTREAMAEGLEKVLALYEGGGENSALDNPALGEAERAQALLAARGVLAFHNGAWTQALLCLEGLDTGDEPDAFIRWMALVCRLETGEPFNQILGLYGAIRARYEGFPEYWYRGARHFSGHIRGEYAERCINLAPRGPFAGDCRGILAETVGLSVNEGSSIKTRAEIEEAITRSVASGNPGVLTELFGLLSLQDNPFTLYTAGALRALVIQEDFKNWFVREAARASGRLAERLLYISRG
ncbi:hypothetical protein LQZ21_04950 [Treponema sp. TIM-1]|uniref:hypothetical protein n=1 Tax=Treponema sp. TIM-1 TaxID=2898417 RepID=UPI00397F2DD4